MIDFTEFRFRVTNLIKTSKVSMAKISRQCGMNPNQCSRYLTGERTPSLEAILALSKYFGVSIEYLLGLDDYSKDAPLSEADSKMLHLYHSATPEDQNIVNMILKKYEEEQ